MLEAGGVKIPESVVELELRVGVLEKILDYVLSGRQFTPAYLDAARKSTVSELQKKYPDLGINYKP